MIAKKEYIFEGVPVQVVRRPRMKNIRVKVVPPHGDVELSCAPGVRNYEWEAVLREAWQGIMAARERFLQGCGERIAADGGRCFLWGKAYELKVVFTEHAHFARLVDGHIVLAVPPGSGREQMEDCLYELYRRELERAVTEIFPKCEQITGLSAKEVRLKRMKTRWG
uniref:YgjP-like metallopeptidase domain-containing protein n=1 Tax=Anaerovibrio slackiae TaxID=2652309 RepID=UPI003863A04C